jgi:hypothetical protein
MNKTIVALQRDAERSVATRCDAMRGGATENGQVKSLRCGVERCDAPRRVA